MLIGVEYKKKFETNWGKWLKVNHDKINYGRLLANEISNFCHYDNAENTKVSNIFNEIKKVVIYLIYTPSKLPVNFVSENKDANTSILFFQEEDGRSDYQSQGGYVKEQLLDFNLIESKLDLAKLNDKLRYFSFKNLVSKIALLLKLLWYVNPWLKIFTFYNKPKIFHFYYRSLLYHDYSRMIQKEEGIWGNIRLVLIFSDMKQFGNMFAQIAKLKGLPSATLQHALYIKFPDNIFSQGAINYKNMTADYILAWGESLKVFWKNTEVSQDKMVIAGSNVKECIREITNFKQDLPSDNFFGLILSAEYWRDSNIKMLEIAQNLSDATGIQYEILFHPTNNVENYFEQCQITPKAFHKKIPDISSFVRDKIFSICHTTTVYYTVLMNKRRCYRFSDLDFVDTIGLDDIFGNKDELLKRVLAKDYCLKNEDFEQINVILEYHFGGKKNNYKKAIDTILNYKV